MKRPTMKFELWRLETRLWTMTFWMGGLFVLCIMICAGWVMLFISLGIDHPPEATRYALMWILRQGFAFGFAMLVFVVLIFLLLPVQLYFGQRTSTVYDRDGRLWERRR